MVYLAQRSLMYFPDTAHVTPAAAGLPEAEEVPLKAADGVAIRSGTCRRKTANRSSCISTAMAARCTIASSVFTS